MTTIVAVVTAAISNSFVVVVWKE